MAHYKMYFELPSQDGNEKFAYVLCEASSKQDADDRQQDARAKIPDDSWLYCGAVEVRESNFSRLWDKLPSL